MRFNKLTGTIIFQNESDWNDFKNHLFPKLIHQFNKIGLIGIIKEDNVKFEKANQKRGEFGRFWILKALFSIIRLADAKLFSSQNHQKVLEISIDVTYLILLSIGLGVCFCFGFVFFISEIGLLTYISSALSIMTFVMTIGLIYIRIVLSEIINKTKNLK